ncbi:MAG: hypothetical protein ACRDO0_03590 [Nocardioidaceae bacterium]
MTTTQMRVWGFTIAFYGGLTAVLALIWLEALELVLPDSIAEQVGHNSEGILLALMLAGWIQFVRSRITDTTHERLVTGVVAAAALAGALALLATDLPSRFKTLNETLLAASLLIPYLQLRRPLGRWALGVAALLLLTVVVAHDAPVIVLLAETLGMLMLAPVALDLVDRGILDPAAWTSRARRWAWYVVLAAAPVAFSLISDVDPGGVLGVFNGYAIRTIEAFLAFLLLEVFFAVCLGRTGATSRVRRPAAVAA